MTHGGDRTPGSVLAGRLAAARARVRARTRGDVVWLDPGDDAPPDGRWDTVVSCGWLPGRDDLPAAVAHLAALLAPRGRLVVLEPDRATGWRAVPAFLGAGRVGRDGDGGPAHLNRDVAAALWASGLRVVETEHLVVEGVPSPLRRWLLAEACFPPTADLPAPRRRRGPITEETP